MGDGDIQKWVTVTYDTHTKFSITAILNVGTWKWDATITSQR